MTEIGNGFYKYDFVAYDNSKNYAILCDGGNTLSDDERYQGGANTNNTIPTEILAETVDSTYSLQDILKVMFSVLASKSSGGGTTSIIFRDTEDSKNRITATVDALGNRTDVTLNP